MIHLVEFWSDALEAHIWVCATADAEPQYVTDDYSKALMFVYEWNKHYHP